MYNVCRVQRTNPCFLIRLEKLGNSNIFVSRSIDASRKQTAERQNFRKRLENGRNTAEQGPKQSKSEQTPFRNKREVNVCSAQQVEKQTHTQINAKIKHWYKPRDSRDLSVLLTHNERFDWVIACVYVHVASHFTAQG